MALAGEEDLDGTFAANVVRDTDEDTESRASIQLAASATKASIVLDVDTNNVTEWQGTGCLPA